MNRHRLHINTYPHAILKELLLLAGSFSRLIQSDIVKEHLARTTGRCHVALGAKANRNPVDVSQVDTLVGKGLQGNDPLGPGANL